MMQLLTAKHVGVTMGGMFSIAGGPFSRGYRHGERPRVVNIEILVDQECYDRGAPLVF